MGSAERLAYGTGRSALLDAAIAVVARDGLSNLTYRSLAAEAGTSSGSVRYHFTSLDEVVSAALSRTFDLTIAEDAADPAMASGDPAAVLEGLVDGVLSRNPVTTFQVEILVASRRRPELAAAVADLYDNYKQSIRRHLDGVAGVSQDLIDLAMCTADGIVFGLVVLGDGQVDTARRQVDTFHRLYRHALGLDPDAAGATVPVT